MSDSRELSSSTIAASFFSGRLDAPGAAEWKAMISLKMKLPQFLIIVLFDQNPTEKVKAVWDRKTDTDIQANLQSIRKLMIQGFTP